MKNEIDVVAAIVIKDGLILSTKRGSKSTLEGYWEFPGGKIETGETPQEALRREIQEELDLFVKVEEDLYMKNIHEYNFGIVNLSTYISYLDKGELILKEHTDYKWLKVSDLDQLDWAPADLPIVERLMNDERFK